MNYLRGFLPIFLEFGDLAAARRAGYLRVLIERRKRIERPEPSCVALLLPDLVGASCALAIVACAPLLPF
jgi:hypothetical protein